MVGDRILQREKLRGGRKIFGGAREDRQSLQPQTRLFVLSGRRGDKVEKIVRCRRCIWEIFAGRERSGGEGESANCAWRGKDWCPQARRCSEDCRRDHGAATGGTGEC